MVAITKIRQLLGLDEMRQQTEEEETEEMDEIKEKEPERTEESEDMKSSSIIQGGVLTTSQGIKRIGLRASPIHQTKSSLMYRIIMPLSR